MIHRRRPALPRAAEGRSIFAATVKNRWRPACLAALTEQQIDAYRRDGADIDWVVAALLHDTGDGLAPQNHDRFAADIPRRFLRALGPVEL